MKSSAYCFHTKTKMLADFQICISAPLSQFFFKSNLLYIIIKKDFGKFIMNYQLLRIFWKVYVYSIFVFETLLLNFELCFLLYVDSFSLIKRFLTKKTITFLVFSQITLWFLTVLKTPIIKLNSIAFMHNVEKCSNTL